MSINGDSSISSSPTVQESNGVITLTNLNTSSSPISSQNSIEITISSFTQPSSVRGVTGFSMNIYYSSSGDMTATATTVNSITTTPGFILSASVSPGSDITGDSPVEYTFTLSPDNPIPANGKI